MNQPSIWLDGDFETQGMEKSIVKITESLSPESVMKSLSEKAPSMIVTGEHRMGPPLDSVQCLKSGWSSFQFQNKNNPDKRCRKVQTSCHNSGELIFYILCYKYNIYIYIIINYYNYIHMWGTKQFFKIFGGVTIEPQPRRYLDGWQQSLWRHRHALIDFVNGGMIKWSWKVIIQVMGPPNEGKIIGKPWGNGDFMGFIAGLW